MFKMAICPHDSSKNKVYWLHFVSYLREKTGLDITSEQCFDFDCYYRSFDHIDLSYSNPMDAFHLYRERGFLPVAGNDNYDEVVIVTNMGKDASLEEMEGKTVPCVENQFATLLALKILKSRGISVSPEHRDSWQAVLNDVASGRRQFGILYKDFWDQLSELSRRGVDAIYVSDTALASHYIMINPDIAQQRNVILIALEDMPEDPKGKEIMRNLRISRWYEVESIDFIEELVEEVKEWL